MLGCLGGGARGLGSSVYVSGFRVQGSGIRVVDSGCRYQASELRVVEVFSSAQVAMLAEALQEAKGAKS